MFQNGDYVVYGCKGIHKIIDKTTLNMDGVSKNKEYYVMQPYDKPSGSVYAPVDAQKINMRKIMSKEELKRPSVNVLFKNQGVYNGLIAVLILVAVFIHNSKIAVIYLMGYIILVAAYGSLTSNPKIILKQGGLAIITLISCLVL